MGTGATGSSIIIGGGFSLERTVASQGIRDKITSVANRLTSLYFYIFILLIMTLFFMAQVFEIFYAHHLHQQKNLVVDIPRSQCNIILEIS